MQEHLSRRELLQLSAAGVLGTSVSGWFDTLAGHAAEAAKQDGAKHKSCILLWMNGGPAQSHTFDLKDGSEYKAIDTSVSGIKISEYLPNLAKQMEHCSILRSMSTGEGSHGRARYLMHTGYRQGFGGATYPSMGSIVAEELGDPDFELPNFVSVGGTLGAGYLGPRYSPLIVGDPSRGVENLRPATDLAELDERAKLLDEINSGFLEKYQQTPIEASQKGYQRAVALMHSSKSKAFNIDEEPSEVRTKYGSGTFGRGCLLARRLVEVGVPFVEVSLGGWDTHGGAATPVKRLSEQIDAPWAALLADLKDRGLLANTLVIWMGEFGRSPGKGTNHYPRAWSTVFAGAGIKAGQVIGATDKGGGSVAERPINTKDFMATVCKALGIDYNKQIVARNSRPFRIVDKDAKPVELLF
ncbi:hypothetical protein AYO44_13145 [Planctomycetaceae bacterium SCGC AG-212-F19]|nr:hypothetical protein AYO44_13145 [Planctomycetaceae bacterium SCGC AG-212-F19]